MIPNFNHSGVLPPYLPGSNPTVRADTSPYLTDYNTFISRFATTPERITILEGFNEYCRNLERLGIISGDLWIDGSFTENVETTQKRPPNDIDLVLFVNPLNMGMDKNAWRAFFNANLDTLHPQSAKNLFKCDAYLVDLSAIPMSIVNNTSYWFGLFSHQRDTNIWKGMLRLKLEDALSSITNGLPLRGAHA